jgi:TonB-dependent starch-binding outer membrane protein SusC
MGSPVNSADLLKRSIISFILVFVTLSLASGQKKTSPQKLSAEADSLKPAIDSINLSYGRQKKNEIDGSVIIIKSDEFNKGYIEDPLQLIQGKVAGLSISKAGSDPNMEFQIRLRGLNSITGTTNPLIIIDGVTDGSLSNVDPNDIESIEVLKGGAAAIYGLRGSAGVIMVKTKRGKSGTFHVEYNGYTSAETVAKTSPAMNAGQWRSLSKLTGYGTDFKNNTNWFNELTRPAISVVQNIALSGGTNETTYRAAFNFRKGDGIMINTGYTQFNGRVNLTQKALKDKLTLDLNLGATQRKSENGFSDAFTYASIFNPTSPVRSSDPAYAIYDGYFQQSLFNYYNPVAIEELDKNEVTHRIYNASLKGEYEIISGLKVDALYSIQKSGQITGIYYDKKDYYTGFNRNGFASKQQDSSSFRLFESTISFTRNITQSVNLSILGGYANQEFKNGASLTQGGNFPTDNYSYNNLKDAVYYNKTSLGYSRSLLIAYFGRINLNINDMFFLSGSGRYEGSSRLGSNNKWSLLPSVGGGVDLSRFLHFKSSDILKLRVDYSVSGNLPIPTNISINLKAEKKGELDAGLDFSLFKASMSGSFDFYTSTTTGLINQYPSPILPFYPVMLNLGKLTSSGLELSVKYDLIKKSDFSYCLSIISSYNIKNNISRVGTINGARIAFGSQDLGDMGSPGQNQTPLIRVQDGKPVGQLIALVYKGIDTNGNMIIADQNNDGIINASDRQVVGNGLPKFLLGLCNTFTYNKWDLSLFFRGIFGHDLINSYRALFEVPNYMTSYNLPETTADMRNPSNGRLLNATPGTFTSIDVENASFVSLDNMSLGYSFGLPESKHISKIKLYLAGNNIFYITRYKGADPNPRYTDTDIDNGTFNNPLVPGVDRTNTWPRTRSVTFGANIVF